MASRLRQIRWYPQPANQDGEQEGNKVFQQTHPAPYIFYAPWNFPVICLMQNGGPRISLDWIFSPLSGYHPAESTHHSTNQHGVATSGSVAGLVGWEFANCQWQTVRQEPSGNNSGLMKQMLVVQSLQSCCCKAKRPSSDFKPPWISSAYSSAFVERSWTTRCHGASHIDASKFCNKYKWSGAWCPCCQGSAK